MTRPMVRIYTAKNVFTDREMNDQEFAQYQIDQASIAEETAAAEAKATAKAELLSRLGITEDEAKLLLS